MVMLDILIPVAFLGLIAVLAAALLSLATSKFGASDDTKMQNIRECLPGVNCGACGYSGCDAYAAALADGTATATNLCTPGADSVAREIAAILGKKADEVVERVAYIGCCGLTTEEEKKYKYQGIESCKSAKMLFGGDRTCTSSCLGYGDCVRVCPRDAISITEGSIARVDFKKCVGCGLCVRTCPVEIIHLVRDSARVAVKCSNHFKGSEVRKYCHSGCIACRKCEKSCPDDAIKVIDNLAVIDYEKCTGCGICADVCPTKCIYKGDMSGASHRR